MRRSNYLLSLIFLSLVPLLVLHLYALKNFWYWKHWWFDNIMHLLGGFAIALIIIFYGKRFNWIFENRIWSFLFGIAGLVLITAFIWEVFEHSFGIAVPKEGYFADTLSDILMGLLGALIGMIVSLRILKNENGQ